MSEYDVALDRQVDWVSFWSSEAGRDLFHGLALAVSDQRKGKGEKEFRQMVDYEMDEYQLTIMPMLHGECYYWKPEMLDIVKSASDSLPDSWSLAKGYVPAASGFFYFSKEIKGIRALGWSILRRSPDSKAAVILLPTEGTMPDFDTVSLTAFMGNPSFSQPIPARSTLLVDETLRDWKLEAVKHAAEINADVEEWDDTYFFIRLFASMLSFLQQRIFVHERWGVSRATRRRIERHNVEPSVNVVRLRSILRRSQEGQAEAVDWACRWIVRGHWREQWYSSLGKHQPVFISPYIKGPEDKPLKDPARLFAVVR